MSVFSNHCSHNTPFFCNYSQTGLSMHCHVDFYEFCLVISGSYEHVHSNTTTTCHIGNILFFAPNEVHSLTESTPNSYHYAILIKKDFFESLLKYHPLANTVLNTPFVEKKLSGVQFAYLSKLASALAYTIVTDENIPHMEQFISSLIFACFVDMPNTTANLNKIYAIDLFQLFNNYDGLSEDITMLCKQFPISTAALIDDFKTLTGYTIVQYRNIKRMEYAAHLLSEANYTITDICAMLNIANTSHFSKQFKKQYGISPKQYQLQNRSKRKYSSSI